MFQKLNTKSIYIVNHIHKRCINNQSLIPTSSIIAREEINPNIPNLSTNTNTNSSTISDEDTALNLINATSGSSSNQVELTVRTKRVASVTISSEDDKKAKLSHDNNNENDNVNDNTSVINSIQPNTSTLREIVNTQTSEIASNTTNNVAVTEVASNTTNSVAITEVASNTTNNVAVTEPQRETVAEFVARHTDTYNQVKSEAYRIIDDIQTSVGLLEMYVGNSQIRIEELEQSIYNQIRVLENTGASEGVPVLMSDNDSDSDSSISDNSDNGFNLNEPNIIAAHHSPQADSTPLIIGMEPLNNGISSNLVIYNHEMRYDQFVHNNYSIHMSGIDTVDYRMSYEYLIESLDYLDRLIVQHQTLDAIERVILPLNNGLDAQAQEVEIEISTIFELLSQFC